MNIKRIIFILLLWWIFISVSEANIYVDANAAFTQTVDAKNQFGGGIGLLFSVHRDINVFLKGIFNTRIRNYGEDDEVSYNHIMNLAGLEYRYNISNMPLYWKTDEMRNKGIELSLIVDVIYQDESVSKAPIFR